MDDAPGVRRFESISHLNSEVQQFREVEWAATDSLRQGVPFEQLHGDEVLPFVLIDCVDGADAGMIEGRRSAGLTLESLEHGRVLGELRGEELQRDMATEAGVLRFVDDAHPTAAELRRHAVVRQSATDHRCGNGITAGPAEDAVRFRSPPQGARGMGQRRKRFFALAERRSATQLRTAADAARFVARRFRASLLAATTSAAVECRMLANGTGRAA